MNIKFNGISFYNQRLVYKAVQSTIAPDAMHVVSRRIAAKNGPIRQQRISSQRGEVNFIAGWSRSSQHATIRYIINYIRYYLTAINNTHGSWVLHCSLFQVSCIIHYSLQTRQLRKQEQRSHDYRRVTSTIRSRWSVSISLTWKTDRSPKEGDFSRFSPRKPCVLHRLGKNLLKAIRTSESHLHRQSCLITHLTISGWWFPSSL